MSVCPVSRIGPVSRGDVTRELHLVSGQWGLTASRPRPRQINTILPRWGFWRLRLAKVFFDLVFSKGQGWFLSLFCRRYFGPGIQETSTSAG